MVMVRRRMKQLTLKATAGHGGKRKGAGRKVGGRRRRTAHRWRPEHARRHPVHVTLRARGGLPSLRAQKVHSLFLRIKMETATEAFRVVHHSLQSDHVHLIVEAVDKKEMSSGLRRVVIRFAKRFALLLGAKKGKVWGDRFHTHTLRSVRQTRNVLLYVLQNAKKHGAVDRGARFVDPFSSGGAFDGWVDVEPCARPVAAPRTWLLGVGWKKLGLLRATDAPKEGR
jgi:REP element-mobilizing transposase RayT